MDNTLIYGLGTMGFGFLAVLVRYGFKSKCSDVSLCCGLIQIKRDVDIEAQEEKREIELRGSNSPNRNLSISNINNNQDIGI